ncbi:MAG TPA: hybrid sensor histidine kinase/response regulator [Chloroflexi bacterium]|nr:hybrid sensor histidine kinase/response regulator [Chloroflexota bacterium]
MNQAHILVVDDHEPLRKAIQGILEAEGYKITTASDGLQALKLMNQDLPDMVIADIMMPRMDGYDLYQAIRSRPDWVSMPFIFLTAKAEKEDKLRGKSLGAEDYLTKPFDAEELLVAVQSRLERAQAIQEFAQTQFEELKQQIASVLGHELRTPLTYVRGYTELALEEVPDTDGLQAFLMGIKRGADRLDRLVEDLMLLVQLDTGQIEEEYQLLAHVYDNASDVFKSTIRQYNQQALNQGMVLDVHVKPNLPPVKLCEPLFNDAVGRLIDNAIKFSHDEERIITIRAEDKDDWVEIAVTDRGVGISAQHMRHLFERFRQFNRNEMEQQGSGLGLALAKAIIELHEGEITVESVEGQGSTFTIRLPVAETDA